MVAFRRPRPLLLARGVGLVGNARRADAEIDQRRRRRQHQRERHGENGAAGVAARHRRFGRIGGEQPALDLQPRARGFAGLDQPAGRIAFELAQLVAIDGAVEFRAFGRRARALHQRQHHRRHHHEAHERQRDRQQHHDPSSSSRARRWRSSALSGGGGAASGRRRRRSRMTIAASTSSAGGPNHSA